MDVKEIPLWQAIPCSLARDWSRPQAAIVLTLGDLMDRAGLLVVHYEQAETCWISQGRFRVRITTRPLKRGQIGLQIINLMSPAFYLGELLYVIDHATMPRAPRFRKVQGQAMRRVIARARDNVMRVRTIEPVWDD